MSHKSHEDIEQEIQEAQTIIKIGGIYSHYKNPKNLYKVISLGTQEATDKICVIYQAEYDNKLIFVRDVDSWLGNPVVNGKTVQRFRLVNK